MRDIRFKVWDIDQKRMYTDCFRLKKEGFEIWNLFERNASKNLIWLQFTGLKDKNGKEIYEGDIVTFERGIGNWSGKRMTTTHEVYFETGISAFVLKSGNSYIKFRQLEGRYIYEVLGNIHEKPDLI